VAAHLRNPSGILALADRIFARHMADGAASKLGATVPEWATVSPKIADGLARDKRAKELVKELEKLYEERDNTAFECLPLIQRSAKVLRGVYGEQNLRQMGDHGYTVDDTPRAPNALKAPKA
jgi:hypothetical protein